MGDVLFRKASPNSAKIEKVSFLPESSPTITYSTLKPNEELPPPRYQVSFADAEESIIQSVCTLGIYLPNHYLAFLSHVAFLPSPGNDDGETGIFFYDCYYHIKKRLFPQHVKVEAKAQLKLAWGIYANAFFAFFIPLTMLFIVGQKGKVPLASAGLGLSICNMTGNVYVIGITSVCETFFSQAYGAKQMRRYSIILQRSIIVTTIAILPSCALWINIDKILLHLGQDKEVAMLAGQFTTWFIPGLFFYVLFNVLLRYLACQNIVYPSAYSAFAAFIVNGICCYVFVHVWDMGVKGGVLAVDLSYMTYSIVLLILIFWKKLYKDTWYGWSLECLCDWKPFVFLSVSSTLLSICEWTCFEIGTIALGVIGSLEQAVQIALYCIAAMVFFGSLGFSISAAIRVGHFIGSGEPERAKLSMRVAFKLAALCNLCIGLFLIALQDFVVYIFTSDRSVINMASKLVYLPAVIEGFDCLQVVCSGVVRGLGYQKYGAIITFVSFLCIGTSSSLLLIFKAHLKVPGFWIGTAIGVVAQTVALFALLFKIDWKRVSTSVRENVGVVVESSSDARESQLDGDETERQYLNTVSQGSLQYAANVEYPSNSTNGDDICLITETIIPTSGSGDQTRNDEEKEIHKTSEDDAPHASQVNDVDVFFVYQPPHLSKQDIFIKVSVVLFLLCGVVASAVVRIYL